MDIDIQPVTAKTISFRAATQTLPTIYIKHVKIGIRSVWRISRKATLQKRRITYVPETKPSSH